MKFRDTQFVRSQRRMQEIVRQETYSPDEKRWRGMVQLELLLEAAVEYLPREHQLAVREVLMVYAGLWGREPYEEGDEDAQGL